jgi:hypothetical protein
MAFGINIPGDLKLPEKTATIAALSISGIAAALTFKRLLDAKRRLPLPPGPPGLPIVGNVFDIPEEDFWWKYKEWGDQYGSSSSCICP